MEATTALIILAFISSSVLVVINRCMASAADSELRMQAFRVARENMEKLLASNSVEETVEYGNSEMYPDIEWQTVVETFYEPLTSRMWIQAVCSAEYIDTKDELQKIELTHWLTDLTKQQLLQIIEQQEQEKELLAEQLIETLEEAADYAGVDEATIEQWLENGMPTNSDGFFITDQLDLYRETDGNPSVEDRRRLARVGKDSIDPAKQPTKRSEEGQRRRTEDDGVKRIGGRTLEELVEMGFPRELLEQLLNDL